MAAGERSGRGGWVGSGCKAKRASGQRKAKWNGGRTMDNGDHNRLEMMVDCYGADNVMRYLLEIVASKLPTPAYRKDYIQPDTGEDFNKSGIQVETAPLTAVTSVLSSPLNTTDGKSNWYWFRLPNGDLALGAFPQGDTYLETEQWRTI